MTNLTDDGNFDTDLNLNTNFDPDPIFMVGCEVNIRSMQEEEVTEIYIVF